MPFHTLNAKHYLNIFTKHQMNLGYCKNFFLLLTQLWTCVPHPILFIDWTKGKNWNPYNKIKTKFIHHWCTQNSLYTNVYSMSEYCVHRTSKPLAFILRVLARTTRVSPEQGEFWLCPTEDVAKWSPLLRTMDLNENWWYTARAQGWAMLAL